MEVALVLFLLLQVAVGIGAGRRVRTSAAFFVADRALGPGLLFFTLVAANIGAGSTVGAAGLGYRDGLAAWWWVGSAAIGSAVLAFTVGPRVRAVAAAHGLHTVGDFLEWRYHAVVRGAIAALLWLGSLAILAGQLVAMAWVLDVVAGVPKPLGCLLGGIVASTYFAAGGLVSAAWVNSAQVVVILAGFLAALPLVLARAAAVPAPAVPDSYLDLIQGGPSGILYLALLGPSFLVSPGLLQKVFGARDDRAVRLGVGGNAIVLLAFAFVPPLLGMAARALHPDLGNRELALPTLLMHDLPPVLGGLGLAAIVAAEVSTADAVLFMLSTSLAQDLYRRFADPRASDARVLAVARLAAVFSGILGVGIALGASSVTAVLLFFYSLLTVSLAVPLLFGLYVPRAGTREALVAIGAGVVTFATLHLAGSPWAGLLGLLAAGGGATASLVVRSN